MGLIRDHAIGTQLKGFLFLNTDHIMENQGNGQTDDRITKLVRVLDQILPSVTNSPNTLRVEEVDEVREDWLSDLNTPPPLESPLHEVHEYASSPILSGTSLHDGFVPVYMDDLDPARPCAVVEKMTGSLRSKNSAIGVGAVSSEQISSLHLSIGLRSIGPEKQSPTTMPFILPDSLTGESTSQEAGERPTTVQAESSPSIESPNASSQQVLPLVPNSISGQIFCFLPQPVLHIQAPPLTPIVEYPPSILTLRVEPTPQLVCTLINARSPCSRAHKRRSTSATHHPDHRPKNGRDGPQV